MSGQVIFIDDDDDLRSAQTQGLELSGFSVRAFSGGAEALAVLKADFDGVVVTDVRMPHMDGMDMLERVKALDADIPVILLTGHGDIPMAVAALKNGAYDFMTKPFAMAALCTAIHRAQTTRRLVLDNRRLRQLYAESQDDETTLYGHSPVMRHLKQTLTQVAEAGIDLLIQGDTGVGKALVARTVHRQSGRRNRPFVSVNCAVLPDAVFVADLFGVESGTRLEPQAPLSRRVQGRIEKAQKGTLFLDDIDGLSLPLQAKLLQVVEARELWVLGAEEARAIDVRIIAASRYDLNEAVRAGTFRADLYYRLSGVTLTVPPLKARQSDIEPLFQRFLLAAAARLKRPPLSVTPDIQDHLHSHDWPGNVRELEQYAERVALGLGQAEGVEASASEGLAQRVARFEAGVLRDTLKQCGGKVSVAMQQLGLARKTFYDKISRYDIQLSEYR